jgi:hypothetical protein
LYEINSWAWLFKLTEKYGKSITLAFGTLGRICCLLQHAWASAKPFRFLQEPALRALAQARLQRLAALDVVRKCTTDLSHESSLIFAVPQGFRGELGGSQVKIGFRELRVLPHRLARFKRVIPNGLRRRGSPFKGSLSQ